MILFCPQVSAQGGFGRLTRDSLLASMLKSKIPSLFLIDNLKAAKNYLNRRSLPFLILKEKSLPGEKIPWPSLLVFDGISFSGKEREIISRAREKSIPVLQLCENGEILADADKTINFSPFSLPPRDHRSGVPGEPSDFPLHPRYRHFHQRDKHQRPRIKYIFISLGGAPPYRPLRTVIDTLYRQGYLITVAPGFTMKNNQIKTLRRLYPRLKWSGATDSLARRFYQCDLAVISGGNTAYEAACTGTYALYLPRNPNQEAIVKSFADRGLGRVAGKLDRFDPSTLAAILNRIPPPIRQEAEKRGKALVDGMGLYRILGILQNHFPRLS